MTLFLLTLRPIRAALRNPIFLIMGIATPIIYLSFFAPLLETLAKQGSLGRGDPLSLFIPGMLPIIAFTTGLFTGFKMLDEINSGVLDRFRVTPASRFSILSGPILFDTLSVFMQCTLFILIALPFGFRANVSGMIISFLLLGLLTIITSSFSNALALILKSTERFAPLCHGMHLPIFLLSGTLLPMSLAPQWLKIISHCNPVYYAVEASRALALGDFGSSYVLYAFFVLIPLTFLTMTWATKVFQKGVA